MQREKGVCFNWDKPFSRGHCCSSKFFLLISDEDEPPPGDYAPSEDHNLEPESDDPSQAQISFHVILGHVAPDTLWLVGRITNQKVLILIDGGSTHNFTQERLFEALGLRTQPTYSLRFMVGNGNELDCLHFCGNVSIHVHGHVFTIGFHILPLRGEDLILGIQWLKSLGLILMNYSDLTMRFFTKAGLFNYRAPMTGTSTLSTLICFNEWSRQIAQALSSIFESQSSLQTKLH